MFIVVDGLEFGKVFIDKTYNRFDLGSAAIIGLIRLIGLIALTVGFFGFG
jgi:hypothetical protein